MTTKHTTGPWRVSGCRFEQENASYKGKPVFKPAIEHGDENTVNPLIAHLCYAGNPSQMEANAILMAAAPELLDALEKLLDAIERRVGVFTQSHIEDAARTAIAKAKGE